MFFSRAFLLLFLFSNAAFAADGFMVGGGAESDSDGGLSAALIGGIGLGKNTWLSAGVAKSTVELQTGRDLETLYADIELDHHFDPIGVRLGAAYWGDSDVLESVDWRAAMYWRNDAAMVAIEYEHRDFNFIIPSVDFLVTRKITFDADGFGGSARFKTSANTSLRFRGVKFDYSIPFRLADNVDAARLISVTRLSLINTIVDHRVSATFSIDHGLKNWEIGLATWEGVIDRSRTKSLTVRYLMPMTHKTDIEFSLGYDRSEFYGDVTFFSLYLYFYGSD